MGIGQWYSAAGKVHRSGMAKPMVQQYHRFNAWEREMSTPSMLNKVQSSYVQQTSDKNKKQ